MASQLRVHHFVAPGPEVAGAFDPDQEVRQPEPPAIEERGLVDHIVPAFDGLTSGTSRRVQAGASIRQAPILGDPSHAPVRRLKAGEVTPFVLFAALGDQVQLRVEAFRLCDQAGQRSQLQTDEMLAREKADQIRGREDRLPVDELHRHHHTARRRQLACHGRGASPESSRSGRPSPGPGTPG